MSPGAGGTSMTSGAQPIPIYYRAWVRFGRKLECVGQDRSAAALAIFCLEHFPNQWYRIEPIYAS